ncbi:MAG: hypothetical protein ACK6D3_11690, partial [Planctomycetaceae bacterium]
RVGLSGWVVRRGGRTLARPTLARQTLARQTLARQTLARQTLARQTLARCGCVPPVDAIIMDPFDRLPPSTFL